MKIKHLFLAAILLSLLSLHINAATHTVTNTNDNGPGSLREAMATPQSPGDLDPTFGNGGRLYPPLGTQISESAADIVIQPDRKIMVLSGLVASGYPALILTRYMSNGSPDMTFGNGGRVTASFSERPYSFGQAIALQADGKYVVIGRSCDYPYYCDGYAARFLPNGQFDPTFNGNGRLLISPVLNAWDIAIQQDGKIVVAGKDENSASFAVARLNSNGSLDSTFGVNGKVTTPVGTYSWANSIVLQPDGKIVVAGGTGDGTAQNTTFALARYDINGSLDSTFGSLGRVITSAQQNGYAAVAIQPDNKLVVGGRSFSWGNPFGDRGVLMRFGSNGLLDTSFGGSGIIYDNSLYFTSLAVQSNGKIVAGSSSPYGVARYLPSGALDSSFGGDGIVTTVFPDMFPPAPPCRSQEGGVSAIAIQRDGKIITAGTWAAVFWCGPWPYVEGEYPAIARYVGDATQLPIARVPFDFDGDKKTDISVWRPSDGNWHLSRSADGYISYTWGANGDLIVPYDFDGDGKADVAVWRPSSGVWAILNSGGGTFSTYTWGASTDLPVVGDYDDDGKADVAVYRPSDGNWHVRRSSDGGYTNFIWGVSGDVPITGDFDGDGQTDIAVRRPSTGEWFINRSTAGFITVTWGVATDRAVQADYDGDGKEDVAIWRPSTGEWIVLRSSDGGYTTATWGASGDVPVPGDYDGDGKADISVARNGTWHINQSTAGYRTATWGIGTDIAIPGKYGP